MRAISWPNFLLDPARCFLAAALFFGLIFIFLVPPLQAPDELSHFFRAYQVSKLQAIATTSEFNNRPSIGGPLPESVKQMAYQLEIAGGAAASGGANSGPKLTFRKIAHFLHEPLDKQKMGNAQFAGSSLYSPVAYLPQAFGIGIAYLLNMPAIVLFYAARLFNLLAFIGIAYIAIKKMPFGKWGLVVLALLPTTLSQAASVSADGMTNSIAFLTVAYFTSVYIDRQKLTKNSMLILVSLCVLLGLCKPIFAMFSLLLLLLPAKKFITPRAKWLFTGGAVALSLAVAAIWSHMVQKFIPSMTESFKPGLNISVSGQSKFMISHPFHFIGAMFETYFGYWGSTFVSSFATTQYFAPLIFALVSYATIAGVWLSSIRSRILTQKTRIYLIVIAGLMLVAISLTLYTTYNVVGSNTVEGLNGRYFIPLAPIVMLVVMTGKWKLSIPKHRELWLALGILVPMLGVMAKVYNLFYGW